MEWTKTHVHCTFHLCWGAYAGLYYHYGMEKLDLGPQALRRITRTKSRKPTSPLFRGFDDIFMAPHSRATDVRVSDVEADSGTGGHGGYRGAEAWRSRRRRTADSSS